MLLQNDGALLPLARRAHARGRSDRTPTAHVIRAAGARGCRTHPPVSPLAGLRARFGADVDDRARARVLRASSTRRCSTRAVLDGPIAGRVLRGPRARGRSRARRGLERALLHVDGPVGDGVPDEFSVRVTRHARRARVRRVEVQLVQVGRARVAARRRGRCRQLEPDGRSEAFMGFGSAELAQSRRSRGGRAATSSSSSSSPPRPRSAACRDRVRAAGGRRPDRSGRDGARAPRRRGRVRRRHRRRLGDRGQRPRVDGAARRRRTSSSARSRP